MHLGDRIMAVVLGLLLLSQCRAHVPLPDARQGHPGIRLFRAHSRPHRPGVTQRRWKDCKDAERHRNWMRHFLLVTGYATIFTLVVVFLPWFQVEDNSFHWTSLLGYYATAALLGSTVSMIADRVGKRTEMHRFSHFPTGCFRFCCF